ncbi:MAG: hypothetical protein U5K54_23760 [Cytophagales bacterium]|nr:hypothetical protein [Cytophagales bacterium]
MAIASGILSSCFNFGIEAGKSMAETAVGHGIKSTFSKIM